MSQVLSQLTFGMFVRVNDFTYIHVSNVKTIQVLMIEDVTKKVVRVVEYSDVKYDTVVPSATAFTVAQALCNAVNDAYVNYYQALSGAAGALKS